MDARTRAALENSIQHWRENIAQNNCRFIHIGSSYCALCELFLYNRPNECGGCPVVEKTGEPLCNGTPWRRFRVTLSSWHDDPDEEAYRNTWRQAAQAMVDFLISLLPQEENPTDAA